MGDFLDITSEAEAQNTTTAEVVRRAWKSSQENKSIDHKFVRLEKRMLTNIFEICSATVGLNSAERIKAAQQVNNSFGKEVVK